MKTVVRRATWLIAAAALVAGATGSALAQTSRSLTVAVLNFTNTSGYGGPTLGLNASAAVETALIESGRYDVVKRDLVNKTLTDLNLTYPLGRTGIVMLAQALEADAVISGEVTKVARDAKTGRVGVTLKMGMTDRASGEMINGAINSGESGSRVGAESSELDLDEAMSKAAFASVRSMNERILPEGTVYGTTTIDNDTNVTLNIGTNSGVRRGMEFIVLRNREQVGRVKIYSVDPTFSVARVVAMSRGVQPEDKVRAVFRLDDIPVNTSGITPARPASTSSKVNVGTIALGAAALFGLVTLATNDDYNADGGVRDLRARATGPYNGAPGADQLPFVPQIKVSWKNPSGLATTDLLGVFVYRGDSLAQQWPARLAEPFETNVYDDGQGYESDFATDPESPLDYEDAKVDGLTPGIPFRYNVRTAWFDRTGASGDGTSTDGEVRASKVVTSGQVTAIIPPIPNDFTGPIADLSNVKFSIQGVPGADRYVLQVSTSPTFSTSDTYPKDGSGFISPLLPTPGRPLVEWVDDVPVNNYAIDPGDTTKYNRLDPAYTLEFTVNLNTGSIDPNVPGRALYWRAGARRSTDKEQPENGGYVWGGWVELKTASAMVISQPVAKPAVGPDGSGAQNGIRPRGVRRK